MNSYAALAFRRFATTLSGTQPDGSHEMSYQSLTRTFRNDVLLMRKLGTYRYGHSAFLAYATKVAR